MGKLISNPNGETLREIVSPDVSVIVPVYNTEVYLQQCIDSLRKQTLKNIEIILIDDGSTDRSGRICDTAAKEDSRIRVVHKAHCGVAAVRNEGVELARAEYIMFADSDDWVEPDFCEVPYRIVEETGASMVIFQLWRHGKDGETLRHMVFPEEGFVSKEKVLTEYWIPVNSWSCTKLFRRELFAGIRYPEGHLYEDVAVTYQLIHAAENVYMTNSRLYHYRDYRPGSTTNTRSAQNMKDSFVYEFGRVDALKEWGYDWRDEAGRLAVSYLAAFGRSAEDSCRCDRAIRSMKSSPAGATRRVKIMFWAYKISPVLFDFISVLTGRRLKESR